MTQTRENRPDLEELVGDLRALAKAAVDWTRDNGAPVEFGALEAEFDRSFALRPVLYLEFLDETGCLEFDAEEGEFELREEIARALEGSDRWRERVAEEFLGYEGEQSGPYPTMSRVVDEEKEDGATGRAEVDSRDTISPGSGMAPAKPGAASPERTGPGGRAVVPAGPAVPTDVDERYERVVEIGSGGFGRVYEGRDRVLDRPVAIKELGQIFEVFAPLTREGVADRFYEVVRAQARISNAAIADVHEVVADSDQLLTVTEYGEKGNLREVVEHADWSVSYALEYVVQIAHGLHAAHSQGLVHGNLKPENVVLDAAGNVRLTDFGLARLVEFDSDSAPGVPAGVGRVEYKAPEQFESEGSGTVRSDIYALGVLFYEMLTGRIPSRRSPMPSETAAEIPAAVDGLFEAMAAPEVERRYESAEQLLLHLYDTPQLVDLLDRRSGVAYLEDPFERGRRPYLGEGESAARRTPNSRSTRGPVEASEEQTARSNRKQRGDRPANAQNGEGEPDENPWSLF